MQSKLVLSFLSLMALAAGGLMTGCDSDATIAKSGVGESCDSSADCNDGLKCLQGACYKSSNSSGGSDSQGGEGSGATGTGATGPLPPVLGAEGESCTRAADCEDGLGCYNNRCMKKPDGEGGEGNDPVRLGQVNEACKVTADCAAGLACRLSPFSNSVSVCTPAGGAIEATGKSCNGAECREDADCCQLPVELHVAYAVGTPYGTGAKSCSDLKEQLDGVDCDGTLTAANNAKCAAFATYCDCDDTWSCSDSGRCVYEAECTEDAVDVVGGCPTFSRAGYSLLGYAAAAYCNSDGRCAAEVGEVEGCTNDASCVDKPVADDPSDTCAKGECTCVKALKQCYRKCDNDLDCPAGSNVGPATLDLAPGNVAPRVCDEDIKVCVPADSCTTNESCVRRLNDVNAVCLDGTCQPSCATDYDCNAGVISSAQYTSICNANKVCEPLGCDEDTECSATAYGVKLFCTAPPVVEPGTNVSSAITD